MPSNEIVDEPCAGRSDQSDDIHNCERDDVRAGRRTPNECRNNKQWDDKQRAARNANREDERDADR
jgi:hypothetical protein